MIEGVELVVFDIAGTTVEVGDLVASAFGSALAGSGVSVTEAEIQARMGASKREVIRAFVEREHGGGSEDRIEHAYSDFSRTLRESFDGGGARPMPGAEETFSWLRENRVGVALSTGFDREVADAVLKAVGWEERVVDASVCGDDVRRGRPAPYMIFRAMEAVDVIDVSEVIAVGDTPLDLRAGTNSGARGVVGVLSGSHTEEQLAGARHTHIVAGVADLPELIESEFAR